MEFTIDESSITFEFTYKSYTINVADFVSNVRPQPGYASIEPEGKISVMVEKHGEQLSSKTNERLGAYIQQRIKGVATGYNNIIDINLAPGDQFMAVLMNAIDLIIPG